MSNKEHVKNLERRRYYLSQECSVKLDLLAKAHSTTPSIMLDKIIADYKKHSPALST